MFDLNNHLPLIAILRGVTPETVLDVTNVLVNEGFTMIEVPLNSPNALDSISLLVKHYQTTGKSAQPVIVGAGTVTNKHQVKQVIATGAKLVVTPNYNQDILTLANEANCVTFCGVMTPTEAFNALEAGATGLKLFPALVLGSDGIAALKSVLPPKTLCFPVGGINFTDSSINKYLKAGADGFGLGSALYKPSFELTRVAYNARQFIEAYAREV